MLWQRICVSIQQCLAVSGIDWTSQRRKLAVAKIGKALKPLELDAS